MPVAIKATAPSISRRRHSRHPTLHPLCQALLPSVCFQCISQGERKGNLNGGVNGSVGEACREGTVGGNWAVTKRASGCECLELHP